MRGTTKPIKTQKILSKSKARLIAHLKADGCMMRAGRNKTNYWLKYEVKDKTQLQEFASDIKNVYGLDAKWGVNPSGFTGKPIPFTFVRSKLAFEDMSNYGFFYSHNWDVPQQIFDSSIQTKKEFLRAFFDDEGTVTQGEIRLYSINQKGLEQINVLLKEFGIYSKLKSGFGKRRNVFGLVINNKESIKRFHKKIGFKIKIKNERLFSLVNNFN